MQITNKPVFQQFEQQITPNYYRYSKNVNTKELKEDTVQIQKNNSFDYSIDDGKISDKDKLENFCKGIISPITNLFSSPKNFLIGAGMLIGGAALTIATGGAVAPLFIALGVTGGAIQLGSSVYKASTATTDEEAKQAWQGIGAGTSSIGMSVAGSKSALKGAGINTNGMNPLTATAECFKQVPSATSKSIGAFTSGQALTNIKNVLKPNQAIKSQDNTETKVKQTKQKIEQKLEIEQNQQKTTAEYSIETEIQTNAEPKMDSNTELAKITEQNVSPEVEAKLEQKTQVITTAEENTQFTKPQIEEKSLTQKVIKKDGTQITIKKDENGQIIESVIKRPDKTTTYKTYENNKCTESYTIDRIYVKENKTFEYDPNTGKIAKYDVLDRNGQTLKEFKYSDGQLQSYDVKQSKTGSIKTYNAKGEIIGEKIDFTDEIKAAIDLLEQDSDYSGYNGNKPVARKTKLLNRTTGQYEDAYITTDGCIYNGESEYLGSMTLRNADTDTTLNNFSQAYKEKDFIDLHKLITNNLGENKSSYKGIGTELVKQAIIESYKQGHGGRIYIQAANFAGGASRAEAFYSHIGLVQEVANSNLFACPEYLIAEFLSK